MINYCIGDVIYNIWKNRFYEIIDYNYKSASPYATLKDLSSNRIIKNVWLRSQRVLLNNGSFEGYEDEYKLSSKTEAISLIRKNKIKFILESDNFD